ncbi:MAG: Diaminohydroxyphosphoribosylaminopyrimidine deaminase / 5-amino-6-(5-phosphoribosylamino)uracil reductase [uncultured Rubrobacteraceae bacterium]|uniref:Riboflavin biosynthesis protein RibD n=1 Tax=uncultured Rubrobacteraceae bacterium TaxID=349277 RepID=A0A6J4NEU5_9ACTN|nr:MAG: Diaminohydroxyphosphoribosylaminopyrimidine deaminase / 5-amino-6-(5-phosphoribosylamino)uracil reductase [uncultured Rubrobacteraceae bacterium]
MDLARRLAERGRFTVAPNPLVGAVVVRDGEVVGEGWHARAGEAHAEVRALDAAGEAAAGATLFVTLEPCNHHGRTPPCVEAIMRAGISRVVVGALDPDPRMGGRSLKMLRGAGISVEVVDDPACGRQNEQFFHRMRTGRPFVHVKLATTLDGRIAASGGDSKWVTGEAARLRAHELRAEAGAVLVGAGTVRADDPTLTARGLPVEPPAVTRVVLDPRLTTGPESELVRTAKKAPLIVFVGEEVPGGRAEALRDLGIEVVAAPMAGDRMDLRFVLEELGRRGIRGVLVEGGGETATGFVERGLADKLTLFYAPRLIGSEGVPMIGALRATRMAEALQFRVLDVEKVGEDVAVTLYPAPGEEGRVHRAS